MPVSTMDVSPYHTVVPRRDNLIRNTNDGLPVDLCPLAKDQLECMGHAGDAFGHFPTMKRPSVHDLVPVAQTMFCKQGPAPPMPPAGVRLSVWHLWVAEHAFQDYALETECPAVSDVQLSPSNFLKFLGDRYREDKETLAPLFTGRVDTSLQVAHLHCWKVCQDWLWANQRWLSLRTESATASRPSHVFLIYPRHDEKLSKKDVLPTTPTSYREFLRQHSLSTVVHAICKCMGLAATTVTAMTQRFGSNLLASFTSCRVHAQDTEPFLQTLGLDATALPPYSKWRSQRAMYKCRPWNGDPRAPMVFTHVFLSPFEKPWNRLQQRPQAPGLLVFPWDSQADLWFQVAFYLKTKTADTLSRRIMSNTLTTSRVKKVFEVHQNTGWFYMASLYQHRLPYNTLSLCHVTRAFGLQTVPPPNVWQLFCTKYLPMKVPPVPLFANYILSVPVIRRAIAEGKVYRKPDGQSPSYTDLCTDAHRLCPGKVLATLHQLLGQEAGATLTAVQLLRVISRRHIQSTHQESQQFYAALALMHEDVAKTLRQKATDWCTEDEGRAAIAAHEILRLAKRRACNPAVPEAWLYYGVTPPQPPTSDPSPPVTSAKTLTGGHKHREYRERLLMHSVSLFSVSDQLDHRIEAQMTMCLDGTNFFRPILPAKIPQTLASVPLRVIQARQDLHQSYWDEPVTVEAAVYDEKSWDGFECLQTPEAVHRFLKSLKAQCLHVLVEYMVKWKRASPGQPSGEVLYATTSGPVRWHIAYKQWTPYVCQWALLRAVSHATKSVMHNAVQSRLLGVIAASRPEENVQSFLEAIQAILQLAEPGTADEVARCLRRNGNAYP